MRSKWPKRMRAVTVNGRASTDFDAAAEWVRVPSPADNRHVIVVQY